MNAEMMQVYQALDHQAVSQSKLHEIWDERAQALAEVPTTTEASMTMDVLIVRLGREFYGLNVQYVYRMQPVGNITPVPGVPAWIDGVVNERGRVLSVFNLRRYLGLAAEETRDRQAYLVVLETPDMEVALLADAVLDVLSLPLDIIDEARDAIRGIPQEYMTGIVNRDKGVELEGYGRIALVILDLHTLLANETLVVYEEVG